MCNCEWRDIETAPKDGEKVIGYFPNEGYDLPMVMQCVFDDGAWQFDIYEAPDRQANPSHWIQLPIKPT